MPALVGTPAPVGTPPLDAFVTTMVSRLRASTVSSRYLGPALSALVINADDGSVVWQHNGTRARMPASAQKLLTTYTVLTFLDPTTTLVTTICRSKRSPSTVYVRGGGDPSLTQARVKTLAAQTATALKRAGRTRVSLHLDGSLFPAPTAAPGWTRGYLRSDVQPVRGLTLAGYRGTDGRLAVGKVLVAALKARGVTATVAGTARTPRQCAVLATTRSALMTRLVTDMLAHSDNDYAEFLLRHAALAAGRTPSWRGAIDHQAGLLADAGVPVAGLKVFDGSGLSRANRMPVATLASVLRLLRQDPFLSGTVFAGRALPLAGRTGTLTDRFSAPAHACARGLVQAKTGTLADAVALAGVARGSDGRDRVFVFLDNGQRRISSVRSALDTLATTVVGCVP
ncbi:MAG: Peptidase family protein [Actinomycetota bacterium]|nr:Peptidase family protein [Actinomycetota bacterium]